MIRYLFVKLLKFLNIYSIPSWTYIKKNNEKVKLYSGIKIFPEAKTLLMETNIKFSPGFYLFGILHIGNNKRVYGNIFSESKFFKQGRPMFANKRRWRVIRIRNKSRLFFEILNVEEQIFFKEIWLIKIPYFFARGRILSRLNNGSSIRNLIEEKKINIWLAYNKLLKSQFKKYSVLNFYDWIIKIEKTKEKVLDNYNFSNIFKFKVKEEFDFSLVDDCDSWIIYKKNNIDLAKNTKKIVEKILLKNSDIKFIFFDNDKINDQGQRYDPNFKSSWNRDLFLNNPHSINSCFIQAKEWNFAIKELIYNQLPINSYTILIFILLKFEINNQANSICHVPFLGFHEHEKKIKGSQIIFLKETSNVLKFFLDKNKNYFGNCKKILPSENYYGHNIEWEIDKDSLLSIIIPTKDKLSLLKNCLKSISLLDPEINYEIIIIDNGSTEEECLDFLDNYLVVNPKNELRNVLKIPGEFNFSELNNSAVKVAKGNVLLFLNNDVSFLKKGWGKLLVQNALRPDIGFVGAKLFYEDKTIQHGGVIMGVGGIAGHSHKFFSENSKGMESRLIITNEFSALTAACLAISKDKFNSLGGFNSDNLKINYNDVDICLKAKSKGLRNIFLPDVQAMHLESKTRGKPIGKFFKIWKKESRYLELKWKNFINNDPFYNHNLSLKDESFNISFLNDKKIKFRVGNQPKYTNLN